MLSFLSTQHNYILRKPYKTILQKEVEAWKTSRFFFFSFFSCTLIFFPINTVIK